MFNGSIVAIVTPMTMGGEIDFSAFQKLIEMHIECGTHAIVILGSTGEAATLTADEQQTIIAFTIKQVAGRIPVIAGTSANGTAQAIANTRAAMQAGVDGCLIMTPAYIKPTQEGLYQHYKMIAEAVAIPLILYNVPGRTACDMQAETVARLAMISNIVGIKEATGDVGRSIEIMRLCGSSIDVYSGEDAVALPIILCGGKGVISVTANIAPKLMSEMCHCALQGDAARAIMINNQLAPLHKLLFVEANPIPLKWCLQELRLIEGGIRLPLTPLSAIFHERLRTELRKVQ